MAPHHPAKKLIAFAVLTAVFALGAAGEASAQVGNSFNLSGLPLPPSTFDRSAPAPLMPQPGGAFTSQTVTMPVPPLARTTLPSVGGSDTADTPAAAPPEDGPTHAALDDRVLDGVR